MSEGRGALFYPRLGGSFDAGYFRVSGVGMGNSFYPYFHAVVLAEQHGGRVIEPAWPSLKPRRLLSLSGERAYVGLFRRGPGVVGGIEKATALLRPRHRIDLSDPSPAVADDRLNEVMADVFAFGRLKDHRQTIRDHLLAMSTYRPSPDFAWGAGGYVAVHVRLGDFAAATDDEGANNTRLPMTWYSRMIEAARDLWPDLPVRVVSDGSDAELAALLGPDVVPLRTGSDVGDLLSLAGASALIASRSTFSTWATFLGDMPSIWPAGARGSEKPGSAATPMYFGGHDGQLT